jgi:hypothetical protein
MAGAKKKQKKPPKVPDRETLMQVLAASLEKQDDLIITYEVRDSGTQVMHVMAGKLITPCMLGTLTNRCDLPDQEGSTHLVLETV